MAEKFMFDASASVNVIDKILAIAEKVKDRQDFTGELAKRLHELSFEINKETFINYLNEKLITCRNFKGLELVRAWDGGFQNFTDEDNTYRLHRLALYLVIYVREITFRNNYRMDQGSNFYFLNELVRDNRHEFIERSKWCVDLFDDLPTLIMQEEFHSEHAIALSSAIQSADISKVEEFIRTRDETVSKIDTWNSEFEAKKAAVEILKDKLDTYETGFNFVGLYQGFSALKKEKVDLVPSLEKRFTGLAAGIVIIPILELIWVLFNYKSLNTNLGILGFIALPTISIIIILFYFLRVSLIDLKSLKSQIMQLELRMTLCQFIQSYAEKSKELKEHNKEGFEKFESLIFSSIVSSDDKIPSTFDGMEQLSSLLKNFKS
ncbi:hypothetical protein [Acinetobacter pseudolwoffii]|jgi:hypothetical protein|uniref:Uncharacterized protein n=1 Tax=Acinetobacter pseudolwoffii TaxID=2053287 RepID=A0A2H9UQ08_9GAMM|nr:hypothetical protein [Acinetobacter pseudolwoffii]PJI33790.1 hypothetical protein CU320_00150 [Acinetobacter pseudolwoffii]